MREGMGLYRGKRLDNGEWVEGFFHYAHWINPTTRERVGTSYYILPLGQGDAFKVDPETVGQWTGLVDKNGVKIFEGDILHSDYGENYKVFYTTKSCSFMAECIQGNAPMLGNYRMGECWSNTIAVIGSIHDKAVEE